MWSVNVDCEKRLGYLPWELVYEGTFLALTRPSLPDPGVALFLATGPVVIVNPALRVL